jgi:hypothetical protein
MIIQINILVIALNIDTSNDIDNLIGRHSKPIESNVKINII